MSTPSHSTGIVIQAAHRFANKHMAPGAKVWHPEFGEGRVVTSDGSERVIDFVYKITYKAKDLSEDEIALYLDPGEDPAMLEEVTAVHVNRCTVAVNELSLIKSHVKQKNT
jgi:hypothetical protein